MIDGSYVISAYVLFLNQSSGIIYQSLTCVGNGIQTCGWEDNNIELVEQVKGLFADGCINTTLAKEILAILRRDCVVDVKHVKEKQTPSPIS